MRCAHCLCGPNSSAALFHMPVVNLIIDLSQFILSLFDPFR